MVYFPTSPEQCFCTTLQNRQKLYLFTQCHDCGRMIAGLFFVDSGVKVNGKYYRDVQMLPAIRHVSDDNFIFQQDSTPAHRAHDTIQLLLRETPISFLASYGSQQSGPEAR